MGRQRTAKFGGGNLEGDEQQLDEDVNVENNGDSIFDSQAQKDPQMNSIVSGDVSGLDDDKSNNQR